MSEKLRSAEGQPSNPEVCGENGASGGADGQFVDYPPEAIEIATRLYDSACFCCASRASQLIDALRAGSTMVPGMLKWELPLMDDEAIAVEYEIVRENFGPQIVDLFDQQNADIKRLHEIVNAAIAAV